MPDLFVVESANALWLLFKRLHLTAAEARAFLNEHFVIARDQTGYSGGSNGDTILLGFNLLGDADDHTQKAKRWGRKRQK